MLRTRSPLLFKCIATSEKPFDLHVLTTPPAFILSQDQTLQFRSLSLEPKSKRLFRNCIPRPSAGSRPRTNTELLKWSLTLPLFSFQRTNCAPFFGAKLDFTRTSRLVNPLPTNHFQPACTGGCFLGCRRSLHSASAILKVTGSRSATAANHSSRAPRCQPPNFRSLLATVG